MSERDGEKKQGVLFIVCGPSGVGKTSLGSLLRDQRPALKLSVSYTTRAPRHTERNGEDYHFVSVDEFVALRDEGAFAEWAEVHGNFYGTTKATIEEAWARGEDLFFDIDYQGAQQLTAAYPEETCAVLVIPPSMKELERRLRGRNTDDEATIQRRLAAAHHELSQFESFDHVVVSGLLAQAVADLTSVYDTCRLSMYLHRDRLRALLAERAADA